MKKASAEKVAFRFLDRFRKKPRRQKPTTPLWETESLGILEWENAYKAWKAGTGQLGSHKVELFLETGQPKMFNLKRVEGALKKLARSYPKIAFKLAEEIVVNYPRDFDVEWFEDYLREHSLHGDPKILADTLYPAEIFIKPDGTGTLKFNSTHPEVIYAFDHAFRMGWIAAEFDASGRYVNLAPS